jgi:hypothetical protein
MNNFIDLIAIFIVGLALGLGIAYTAVLLCRNRICALRYAAGFEAGKHALAPQLNRTRTELDNTRTECFVLEQAAKQHRELLEAVSQEADARVTEANRRANPLTAEDLASITQVVDKLAYIEPTFRMIGSMGEASHCATLRTRCKDICHRLGVALEEQQKQSTDASKVAA